MTLKKLFLIIVLIVSAVLVWFLSKPLAVATNGLPFQLEKEIDFEHRGEYIQISEYAQKAGFDLGIRFIPDENLVGDYNYDDYFILYQKDELPSNIVTRRVFDSIEECQSNAEKVFNVLNKDEIYEEKSNGTYLKNRTESIQWSCHQRIKEKNKFQQYISYYLN